MHRPRRLDVDQELIDRAKAAATELTGGTPSFRELARLAIDSELDAVVAALESAGLVHRPGGRARPRELDDATWAALGDAEVRAAVGRVELIRCCLERLARRGPGSGIPGNSGDDG